MKFGGGGLGALDVARGLPGETLIDATRAKHDRAAPRGNGQANSATTPCQQSCRIVAFTMANAPSESHYGFKINAVPGTIWETSITRVSFQTAPA